MGFKISTYEVLEEHKALEVEEVTIEPVIESVVETEPELEDTNLTPDELFAINASKLHLGKIEGNVNY